MPYDPSVAEAIAQFNAANEPKPQRVVVEQTPPAPDNTARQHAFDLEVDKRVKAKLEDAGIRNHNDLALGRADMGKIAALLDESVQDDVFAQEKIERNYDWQQQAQGPNQPGQLDVPEAFQPAAAEQSPDPLASLQAQLVAKEAELAKWKQDYGLRENKLGEERKRVAERLARLEAGNGVNAGYVPQAPAYQPQPTASYDPRILGDVDPNAPLSAGQTAALLQNLAAAFGQQMNVRDGHIFEAARELRNYDLTTNEEADLIERHGWLATLDRTSQVKAMRDLVTPLRAASQPAAKPPITPQRVDMQELARARVRTATTFIEPSSQGSPQETGATQGTSSDTAKKLARIQELLRTPGGAEEAERLMKEVSARRR